MRISAQCSAGSGGVEQNDEVGIGFRSSVENLSQVQAAQKMD